MMVDIVDRATRSRMMSGIRNRDTKPEKKVRSYLHRAGLRFRLHASLPGKPDLVLPKFNSVVFVHGCFWHRHAGCKYTTTPSSNTEFWQEKFDANIARDKRASRKLREAGWRVLIVWACMIDEKDLQSLVRKIRKE